MGYYHRGDYYRGDYYRGDPFLGGLIGGLAKSVGLGGLASKAAKWVGQRITGSSVKKAVVGTVATAAAAPILKAALPVPTSAPMPIQLGPIGIDPMSALPGGQPFVTWGRKKYRKMNPLNPRALKRALRRAEGFEKFAKRTVNALYKTSGGTKTRKFKKCTSKRS